MFAQSGLPLTSRFSERFAVDFGAFGLPVRPEDDVSLRSSTSWSQGARGGRCQGNGAIGRGKACRAARLRRRAKGNTLLPTLRARATIRRKLFDPFIEPLVPLLPLWRNFPTNPELSLYAEVVFDAVRLVRGESVAETKRADVRAARYWIRNGNIGVVTFDACCAWLGWDPQHTREAIFSFVRAA